MPENKAKAKKYEIRLAETREEKESIYHFRYKVYVEEMGKSFRHADHSVQILTDEFDETADIYCIKTKDGIASTIRVNYIDRCELDPFYRDCYALERFSHVPPGQISMTSRLMVAPAWRKSKLLGRFLNHIFEEGRKNGAQLDFCYCAPFLVRLYEYLGYRQYKDNFNDPDVGYRIPLVLVGGDMEHLKSVGSPFHRIAAKYPDSMGIADWFRSEFPDAGRFVDSQPLTPAMYWEYLAGQVNSYDIPILRGLEDDQVNKFLANTTLIRCHAGDRIVQTGEMGKEMFFILDGAAEVRRIVDSKEHAMVTLGRGQIFGEIAYISEMPRSADVVALTELEALILTQDNLKALMAALPEISSRILFNLSVILCERLHMSTRRWVDALSIPDPIKEDSEE